MKRIVYGLGFTAKEHIAIAEKLLSEPPKERFDRVVVDKKIANREGHLRDLRRLIKMVRTLRPESGREVRRLAESACRRAARKSCASELVKLSAKLQETLPPIRLQTESRGRNDRRGRQRPRKIQGQLPAHPGDGASAHLRRTPRRDRSRARQASAPSSSSSACPARNFTSRSPS